MQRSHSTNFKGLATKVCFLINRPSLIAEAE